MNAPARSLKEPIGVCLVIDDCNEMRKVLKQKLFQVGYDMISATNSKHATAKIQYTVKSHVDDVVASKK